MALNQIQFGAPSGGPGADIVQRMGGAVNKALAGKSDSKNSAQSMVAQHVLSSVRAERQHGYDLEKMGVKHSQTRELQDAGVAAKSASEKAGRRHETRITKLTQGHEIAKMGAAFAGIGQLGESGKVSEFKIGDMSGKFNAPRETPAPVAMPTVPDTTPPPVTSTPSASGGRVGRDPKTGRAVSLKSSTPPQAKRATGKRKK
jgi:hypothetical protein